MTDPTASLLDLAQGVGVPIGDGRPPAGAYDAKGAPMKPHAILYGGVGAPDDRRLPSVAAARAHVWQLVVVNNNPAGVRLLADRAVASIDGERLAGGQLATVEYVGPVLEDRDDVTAYRWSCSLEIHATT